MIEISASTNNIDPTTVVAVGLPKPIEARIDIGDGIIVGSEYIKPSLRNRILGKVGLTGAQSVESSAVLRQRNKFFCDFVDAVSNLGSYGANQEATNMQIDENDYELFGYPKVNYKRSRYDDDFHKENDPEQDALKGEDHSYDWFRVVEDSDGVPWLLKTANKLKKHHATGRGAYEFVEIAKHFDEVYAYNIASRIGYPVPETKAVTYAGKPWLAYRYIADHKSVFTLDFDSLNLKINNPLAFRTRAVFNMLIGCSGDGIQQGIIDPANGMYYAQDLNLFGRKQMGMSHDELKDSLLRSITGTRKHPLEYLPNYGFEKLDGEEEMKFVLGMLDSVMQIEDNEAKKIFEQGRGAFKNASTALEHLKLRAQVIKEILLEQNEPGL